MGIAAQAYNRPIAGAVATVGVDERKTFLRKAYGHLAGAVGLFVLLEYFMVTTDLGLRWTAWSLSNWLIVLVLFMGSSYLAQRLARSETSRGVQYLGLALLVGVWAMVFAPIMSFAVYFASPTVLPTAALLTLTVFGGLTATVIFTKKDFSFLGGILNLGFWLALALIVAGLLFGFSLGLWFCVAMVALAAGSVLFSTSRVLAYYPPTHWVAAAVELFSALALLFFYILHIVLSLSGE